MHQTARQVQAIAVEDLWDFLSVHGFTNHAWFSLIILLHVIFRFYHGFYGYKEWTMHQTARQVQAIAVEDLWDFLSVHGFTNHAWFSLLRHMPRSSIYNGFAKGILLWRKYFAYIARNGSRPVQIIMFGKGSCAGLSYNLANMTCVINSKACLTASAYPDYEIIVFRPIHPYRCIHWVDSEPARRIAAGNQNVGRATHDNQLLPGRYHFNGNTYVAWASIEHRVREAEYLEVDEHCSVTWVPYTAGDPIMSGAVEGSSLPDGTPLYVINILIDETRGVDGWAYGYYRPDTELGYAGYNGHRTKTEMEMMAVI